MTSTICVHRGIELGAGIYRPYQVKKHRISSSDPSSMMHQYKGVPRHDPASDPLRLCLAERLRCEYTTIDPPLSRGVPHHTLPHFLNNRFIRHPLGSSIAVYSKNPLALPHLRRGPHAIRIFLVFNADILGELLQYFGMGGYMGIL